ncbi:uncharacterized protein A4U43_C01F23320 [Asparagus officinalis]|uniref:RNase III domain-containing protein n=1 Tax=Asparagus officinalis TaxID=4686 RepID=A0A5P1FRI8_ASPOF|nr:uncharacterized protein LOC109828189 [Asparagus officinalis]ONK80926.1 uncharacterized protein A4U43_C01F23320 [Asparagus officinalis]
MALTSALSTAAMASARVQASWDTNPNPKPLSFPKTLKNSPRPSSTPQTLESPAFSTAVIEKKPREQHPCQFLSSNRPRSERAKLDERYLGYERWLPVAPKVKKPRSIYNATSLAYVGDCIYELYARRHFLFPPLSINEYNERVMKVVRCESQDLLLKKLLSEDYLTEEERDVLRWGKNIATSKTRTTKRVGVAVYNRASSLETLIGYLYLTDVKRLEELMYQLGFSTGASSGHIAEELRKNFRKSETPKTPEPQNGGITNC